MSDKPAHHRIAEEVLKKIAPATRKRLTLTAKGSYTVVADDAGWLARITGKLAEFNKKAIDPKALREAGLTVAGKDDFHRLHSIVVSDGGKVAASESEEVTADGKKGVLVGADEIAKAITVATKGRKSAEAAVKAAVTA